MAPLWFTLSELGYNVPISYGAGPWPAILLHRLPLDPIHVAGQVRLTPLGHFIRRIGSPFLLRALQVLQDDDFWRNNIAPSEYSAQLRVPRVLHKWSNHIQALSTPQLVGDHMTTPVIEQVNPSGIRVTMSYFAVPKTETCCRAILNGKGFSKACQPPPPVNLAYLPELLRRIDDLSRLGPLSFTVGDFRHWFHQLPLVTPFIKSHFGVILQGDRGQPDFQGLWKTLPMGFSWAPFCAQGLALAVLTYHEDGQEPLIDLSALQVDHLPTFIPIMKQARHVGFLTVYYDNYLVACIDPDLGEVISQRIKRNAKQLNVCIKAHQHFTARQLRREEYAEYLGISLRIRRISNVSRLEWRHEESRFVRYHRTFTALQPSSPLSYRQLAELVGLVIYHETVVARPLVYVSAIIKTLCRHVKCMNATSCSWDSVAIHLGESEILPLLTYWQSISSNSWSFFHGTVETKGVKYVCCDSSDRYWGHCALPDSTTVAETFTGHWPPSIQAMHIYIKECLAAIYCLKHHFTGHTSAFHVVIGIDNTAAAVTLQRMYSTNEIVNRELVELADMLKMSPFLSFTVVGLRSEHNASDPFSRPGQVNDGNLAGRTEASFRILHTRHVRGYLWNDVVMHRTSWRSDSTRRHQVEPLDDGVICDVELDEGQE